MKVMIFLDFDHFKKSISKMDENRKERVSEFPNFIIEFLNNKKKINLSLIDVIRTYAYTGQVHDGLLDKIKKQDKSDTYDEIIKDLIEDRYTLNKETLTLEELKRKYDL